MMTIDDFILRYRFVINEFMIVNSHFDDKKNSRTVDYDVVFSNWKKDVYKKYKSVMIFMNWATSSPTIANNQIHFDTFYKKDYFFEVKYRFGQKYTLHIYDFIEQFRKIYDKFNEFHENLEFEKISFTNEYENLFNQWKKGVTDIEDKRIMFDILWDNNNKSVKENALLFNVVFGDDYLFQIRKNVAKEVVQEFTIDESEADLLEENDSLLMDSSLSLNIDIDMDNDFNTIQ